MKILYDGSTFDQMQTGSFNFSLKLLKDLIRITNSNTDIRVFTTRRGKSALSEKLAVSELGSLKINTTFPLKKVITVLYSLILNNFVYTTFLLICIILLLLGMFQLSSILKGIFVIISILYFLLFLDEMATNGLSRVLKRNKRTAFLWIVDLFEKNWKKPGGVKKGKPVCEIVIWRGKFRYKNSFKVGCILDMTPVILPSLHASITVEEFNRRVRYYETYSDVVLTISESSRNDIVKHTCFNKSNMYILPIDVDDIFKKNEFGYDVIKKLKIPDRYVLCVSTIEPRKNLRRLIRAFELLKQDLKYSEYKLVLVGPKGWDYDFEQFLLTSDVYNEVIYTGHVPTEDLPSLYQFASAFVFPSIYEGFGLPILEAMCSEALIVSSKSSSMPEVLGERGIYFNPFNTLEISNKLKYALSLTDKEKEAYRMYSSVRAKQFLKNDHVGNFMQWIEKQIGKQP